jgi:regulator of RNase E activity RraB
LSGWGTYFEDPNGEDGDEEEYDEEDEEEDEAAPKSKSIVDKDDDGKRH